MLTLAPLGKTIHRLVVLSCCSLMAVFFVLPIGVAQNTAASGVSADSMIAEARAQVTTLRDAFISAIDEDGFKCSIPPPTIVMEHVFSYGSYDEDTNTLRTSAWDLLTREERAQFSRMVGPGATETAARLEFETGVHHWVFVHEMGHWFQKCRHVSNQHHYAFEAEANRLAAAWWSEHDPSILTHQRTVFAYVAEHMPGPALVSGQTPEVYFDAHYPDSFSSSQEYVWFQARMCLAAFDEKPFPTFAEALRQIAP